MSRAFNYLLLAFVFFLPLSWWVNVRLLFPLLVIALMMPERAAIPGRMIKRAWDVGLYLLILTAGLFYSTDVTAGLKTLETNFSLLAVPLVFAAMRFLDKSTMNKLYYAFASGTLVAALVCLAVATLQFFDTGNLQEFFYYELTDVIRAQPTYFAYYIIFVITYGLYLVYNDEAAMPLWLAVSLLIFLVVVLILTGGNTAFISLLLIFSFFVLKFILDPTSPSKRAVIILVGIMMVLVFLTSFLSQWNDQFVLLNDYWERAKLWEAALHAGYNPLFGVGTGDVKSVLNDYYRTHGLTRYSEESLNAHNQFLQVYVSNGFLGVVSLILMLARPVLGALRSQQPQGILIFFPLVIYGMNEVFLGRYQGVIFFIVLHQILMCYYDSIPRAMQSIGREPGVVNKQAF